MRTVIKNVFCCASFTALFLVFLLIASLIVQPKNNAKEDGMLDSTANGILSEPENTIDVLILGDSEAYSSFIPLKIWQDYGITSYVCATSAQPIYYSADFLHKAFQTQKPKVVILETNTIFRMFTKGDVLFHKAAEVFSVFQYHDRWKTLRPKDMNLTVSYTHMENNKGYLYNTGVSAANTDGYMKFTEQKQSIPAKNLQYVKEIQLFCEKNGARLVLVSAPSTKNWNYQRHNSIESLSRELGVPYLDMNVMPESVPIDWSSDTRDKGDHVNHSGAKKVTDCLGRYLAEQKLFADKRSLPTYAPWNDALLSFNRATGNALQ